MKQVIATGLLTGLLLMLTVLAPGVAHADVGSTIVGRLWESVESTMQRKVQSGAPKTVSFLQEAEKVFLGGTEDITAMTPIQDVFKAMRVGGLLLLGLCTIISLSQLTEAGLMGQSADFGEWIKRFGVATFMTMGGIYFYGIWIRIFNVMLDGFRGYLDSHWQGPNDISGLYTQIVNAMTVDNFWLILLFSVITIVVLIILWFLIGGIRTAELAIAVIIAPLVWPLYLVPSLDDIPKSAFRSFLGLNAVLLIIVAMLRLAMRMELGGGLLNSAWNFVPAISMLIMTIFLPSIIKKLVGQGNTGAGGLMTAAYMLAGLKGLSLVTAAGGGAVGAIATPPAAAAIPQTPTGPSAYPLAAVPQAGSVTGHSGASQASPLEHVWSTAPRQVQAGAMAARGALPEPWTVSTENPADITLGQSEPGSNSWDKVIAINRMVEGARDARHTNDPK